MKTLGAYFAGGLNGFPKDDLKALDCWIRAVELGSPETCAQIAMSYSSGRGGVNKDMERKELFFTVGALRGSIFARHEIGISEYESGNFEIGIRHWKIAAEAGMQQSIDMLKKIYNSGTQNAQENILEWKSQPSRSIDDLQKLYSAPERFVTMPGKEFISKEYLEKVYRSGHDAQMEVKSEEREKHREDILNMKC